MAAHAISLSGRVGAGPRKNQNFRMTSGDDFVVTITVKDDSREAIDLTGATIEFRQAVKKPGGRFETTAKITKTTSSGIAITDATNGVFTVTMDPADTDDLAGRYYYEIQVTDSGGDIATVTTGTAIIDADLVTP